MTFRELALQALTVLLILAALGCFFIAAFNFWLSFGPPTPLPKDVYVTRMWLAMALGVAAAVGAGVLIWHRRARRA